MDVEHLGPVPDYVWLYLLGEAQQAGQESFAEQAWQYITEFSPDYMSE